MRLTIAAALAVMSAATAAAQTPAVQTPPVQAPPASSLQTAYNMAQAAFDRNDWGGAADGFSKVLAGMGKEDRSAAIIRTRLAEALMNLQRFDEAQAQAAQGVAELRAQATGPDEELAFGYATLGDIDRLNFAYDEAVAAYQQAKTVAPADDKSTADLADVGIIQAAMVTHPDLAASTADAMIADPAFAARTADLRSQIYALRARAELNRGDAKGARVFIDKAVTLSGSLEGHTISLGQEEVRSDAGLIYAKLQDRAETHRFLAYSGAGELPDQKWFADAHMDPPVCGPDVQPDDTAVVEFSIADNGATAGAAPVYASRPGPMGVEFAKAVRELRWAPEAVAASKPFWRAAIRVQMRCAMRPPALALAEPFEAATRDWLKSKGVTADIANLGTEGPSVSGAETGVAAIPGLFRAVAHRDDKKNLVAIAAKLDDLLVRSGAPVEARALAVDDAAHGNQALRSSARTRAEMLADALPTFDRIDGGQRAAALLRVEMAVALETAGDFAAAKAPLQAVVALPPSALASDDPIRSVAVLHLSLLDKKFGDPAAAEALRQQSGLTEQGCNLLDVQPIPTDKSTNSSEFPSEAMQWGFGGWVKTGYDISPDGKVQNARALISYPPFIFDDAAATVVSRFRYLPPSLGGESLSCSGETQTVQFVPALN